MLSKQEQERENVPALSCSKTIYDHDGITIVDHHRKRFLYFSNNLAQGAISLDDDEYLLDYQATIKGLLVVLAKKVDALDIRRICVVGLGAGTITRMVQKLFPTSSCITYDASQHVIDLYNRFFKAASDSFEIRCGDADLALLDNSIDLYIMDINDPEKGFFCEFEQITKQQKRFIVNTQSVPETKLSIQTEKCESGNYIAYNI